MTDTIVLRLQLLQTPLYALFKALPGEHSPECISAYLCVMCVYENSAGTVHGYAPIPLSCVSGLDEGPLVNFKP